MMTHTQLSPQLSTLLDNGQAHLLRTGLKGIEKESLRVSKRGFIAQTNHPYALGSALTHPHITTDYSEALLEFITPPFAEIQDTLAFMDAIHQFVYPHLDEEMLLASSMPCGIDGDSSIRIAQYGRSNIGQMKHIYRHGLWHRYGRTMQAIAGVHFNYSVPVELWAVLHQNQTNILNLKDFIAERYFALIRNFQRQGWLILYLFGASPAICKQFFNSRPRLMAQFEEFDNGTLYHPYATSLRMSDIGYKSNNQASLNISYNNLSDYVDSLTAAISTPYPEYEKIGVKIGDEYQQLNSNILQIENEFYSTVRPKQISESGERPTLALKRRGVQYVEIRSLDLDVFNPLGIAENTARFVEAFLLSCLFQDSPVQGKNEQHINNQNQLLTANFGRRANLQLNKNGDFISLKAWALQIFETMLPICVALDVDDVTKPYQRALAQQQLAVENPQLTPSARILAQMREHKQCFKEFGIAASTVHEGYFKERGLAKEKWQQFTELASLSHQQQQAIEASDTLSLEDFLAHYFAQH
jgi:glutamate--cysteine ligase